MAWSDPGILFDESLNQSIREALPELVVVLVGLSTHLGDGATVTAIAVLLYWFSGDDRRTRIFIIAVGLGALGLSTALKGVLAVPRPDPAVLTFAPENYPGYSLPSAHALGAAAVYSMLAIVLEIGRRWQRYLVAGAIVATVMLSRVVLGVHYVGDVLVGAALGFGFVALMFQTYPDVSPESAFAAASVLGLGGYALGARQHSLLVVGASLGGLLTWYAIRDRESTPTGAAILVLGVLALPPLLLIRVVSMFLGVPTTPPATGYPVAVVVGYAIVTSLVLLVPVAAARLNDRPAVRWLQQRLPFRGRRIDPEATGTTR